MNKPEREGFVENEAFEIDTIGDRTSGARPRSSRPPASARPMEQQRSESKLVEPELEAVPAAAPEPEPAEAKAVEPPIWPLVIELRHKKIKAVDEIIEKLTLREPTAGDIAKTGGNPVRIEVTQIDISGLATFNIVIDDKKMMALISQLSGVLTMFIEKMDPRDYNSVAYRLRRFFIPEQGLW